MREWVVGIDLGGTNVKVGLFNHEGQPEVEWSEPTGEDLSPEAVAQTLGKAIRRLTEHALNRDGVLRGVGVGVPGGVYEDRRTVSQSPNFPGWLDVDLVGALHEHTDLPITLENDANAAALGEAWLGSGRGVHSLALFTLGTGVGGGLVLEGRVWRGAFGMAGELGHITIDRNGPVCGCGNRGCLEAHARRDALMAKGRAILSAGRSPILEKLLHERPGPVTPEMLYDAALGGCSECREVFVQLGRDVGIAAASLLNTLNVAVILIGGGVGAAFDLMRESLVNEIHDRAFRIPAQRVVVDRAVLGNRAGCIGAAKTAWLRLAE